MQFSKDFEIIFFFEFFFSIYLRFSLLKIFYLFFEKKIFIKTNSDTNKLKIILIIFKKKHRKNKIIKFE